MEDARAPPVYDSGPRDMTTSFRSAHVDDVHVSRWCAAASVADIERLQAELADLSVFRESVSILLVVPAGVPLSGDDSRRAAGRMLAALGPQVRAVAIVIEGTGFGPAAVRAMFTGIALLTRPRFQWTLVRSVDLAAGWLCEQGADATLGALIAAASPQ